MSSLHTDQVRSALKAKLKCESRRVAIIIVNPSGQRWQLLSYHDFARAETHNRRHDSDKIAHQIKLGTTKNFAAMVQCSLSAEECLKIIRAARGNWRKNQRGSYGTPHVRQSLWVVPYIWFVVGRRLSISRLHQQCQDASNSDLTRVTYVRLPATLSLISAAPKPIGSVFGILCGQQLAEERCRDFIYRG